MKITPTCVPCLLNRIIFESKQITDDEKVQTQVIRNACNMLGDLYDPSDCSATIATKIHQRTYELLKTQDPYHDLKTQSNKIASSLVPTIQERIRHAEHPLKTAILVSIVGNTLDFGIEGGSKNPEELKQVFDQIYNQGLGFDDTSRLFSLLKHCGSILYFTDNCGEIVFDKLVCEQLKKIFPTLSITLVVKGEPVLSDATVQDAKELGFNDLVDEILTTGGFAVGVDLTLLPEEVLRKIDTVDLIVCKGMANYESFSETDIRPIVYLLRSKCEPIATSMHVPLHANIVKLYE